MDVDQNDNVSEVHFITIDLITEDSEDILRMIFNPDTAKQE